VNVKLLVISNTQKKCSTYKWKISVNISSKQKILHEVYFCIIINIKNSNKY